MSGCFTARASANIAFVKYWGNVDARLRLPLNDSVSMNLSSAVTWTTVQLASEGAADEIVIDGKALAGPARERVVQHLDLFRGRAGSSCSAHVVSDNTFPMGTGIASSASGFAALTVAAAAAYGLVLTEAELSALARRGSGSAARSIPDGFVWWQSGDDSTSHARSIADAGHWDLRDIVVVVSREHKALGSTDGHAAALGSPCLPGRLAALPARLEVARRAIADRDLSSLGPMLEEEALSLHAVALTGRPPVLYWSGETVALMKLVAGWRGDGVPVYFTLDAGPNVHLLCEGPWAPAVQGLASALPFVHEVIANAPAGPAVLIGR